MSCWTNISLATRLTSHYRAEVEEKRDSEKLGLAARLDNTCDGVD